MLLLILLVCKVHAAVICDNPFRILGDIIAPELRIEQNTTYLEIESEPYEYGDTLFIIQNCPYNFTVFTSCLIEINTTFNIDSQNLINTCIGTSHSRS